MKTDLDYLPESKQRDLRQVVDILMDEFEQVTGFANGKKKHSRIVMMILFGSYARDSWVENREGGYISDYDILVVLNREELVEEYKIWHAAEDRIERKISPPVNIIVHSIDYVNNEIALGQYFFKDIKNEGVLIYNSGSHNLVEPGNLTPEEARNNAENHFKEWFSSAGRFLEFFQMANEKSYEKEAAFLLHQAVERFYSTILLVFTNYKPRTHDLKHLNSLALLQDQRFIEVFPQDTKFHRRCFELLRKAYIEARYSEHYKISEEELTWLSERVRLLHNLTEEICKKKIASYEGLASEKA